MVIDHRYTKPSIIKAPILYTKHLIKVNLVTNNNSHRLKYISQATKFTLVYVKSYYRMFGNKITLKDH